MEELLRSIVELLRAGECVDDARIAKLCRAANAGVRDVRLHVSKKRILPFYLRVREEEPQRWESWGIGPQLEEQLLKALKSKPRRTASGVATITVITKPWPCGSDCLYCPNDLRMPKSYLADEPACRRAERAFFDPYLQVSSRLFTLEQMGHVTDKVELIVLGGTWTDYPSDYRVWFVERLFAALNASGSERRSECQRLRAVYSQAGISCDEEELATQVAVFQEQVEQGSASYNELWPLLYGAGVPSWSAAAAWQRASMGELERQQHANEAAAHRVVGLVVETRPEALSVPVLTELRQLGCTKVQIGVQTLDEEVCSLNRRPSTPADAERAFALLRLFGFKIHAHYMANLHGSTPQRDVEGYRRFVTDPRFQPDELKLYPCALIRGSALCRLYEAGEWVPYGEDELIELLVRDVLATPPYTRVSRMIRDFSAQDIVAGVKKTNLRQMVEERLEPLRPHVVEIRFREIATAELDPAELRLDDVVYQTTVSTEHFLQWVDSRQRIAGFLRLSLPKAQAIEACGPLPQPLGCAMIREVHVYGKAAALHAASGSAQHLGLGTKLIKEAERIARGAGFTRINVISAVGTRPYYAARGYAECGLYQSKAL
ncbi:MAG: elongator complex protein 3 [Coriobacteriales bacterium]